MAAGAFRSRRRTGTTICGTFEVAADGSPPDPWLLDGAIVLRADEAHVLWPLIQRGMVEWRRMGATRRLEAVGDLVARCRTSRSSTTSS